MMKVKLVFVIDVIVTYQMPTPFTVSLVKSPFAESLVCMCKTAHLHKRTNGHCKN